MGQAKLRGSFEQRKAAAVELALVRDEAALQARRKQDAQYGKDPLVVDGVPAPLTRSPSTRRLGAHHRVALLAAASLLSVGSLK